MKLNKDYFKANKELWDAKTNTHITSDFYNLSEFKQTKNSLKHVELTELPKLKGKAVLHLQCHFGQDSISLAQLGANVTAIDLSPNAIKVARELAKDVAVSVNFIESNVYDIDQTVQGEFDLIFASYGTICWLPDLDKWAKLIAEKLKPGGQFYFVEFHPFLDTLDDEYRQFGYPYFNESVLAIETEGTYTDRNSGSKQTEYLWNHSISEVLNALINQGLSIDFFNEFPYTVWPCFPGLTKIGDEKWTFEHLETSIPMMYSLLATKG
ncbi:MAG: class I SAM-dependent methyltransferase [Flavobacteriales bacterium]|nr:class I SAM-dependent methyltransferase [Flavobacteriales bacterium]